MEARRIIVAASSILALLFLMGMGGPPGCTGSQRPLGDRDEYRTDYYLLGRWHDLEVSDEGEFGAGALRLEVGLLDDGDLSFLLHYDEDGSYARAGAFTGYTTRLAAGKYLNLRFDVPWYVRESSKSDPDSQEDVTEIFGRMPCQYLIVRYSTFIPEVEAASESASIAMYKEWNRQLQSTNSEDDPIADIPERVEDPALTQAILREAKRYTGRLLLYAEMDDDFVAEAIADGVIEGLDDCDDCLGACIRLDQAALSAFVLENEEELFRHWEWLVREPH